LTPVHTIRHRDRVVRYIDKGDAGWRPLVFFGGLATSVLAFELTEFARATRERLRLRVLSVERNGFGETAFDSSLGIARAADTSRPCDQPSELQRSEIFSASRVNR
jgi:hypothetical protein